MENIDQIRKISIWIFIIPVVTLNLCLFVSVNYLLFENTIFQVSEIGRTGFTIPYIDGAVSALKIIGHFGRMTIEISSTVNSPEDKLNRGKISWLKNQIKRCENKNYKLFKFLEPDLIVDVYFKFYGKSSLSFRIDELDSATNQIGNREIREFRILYLKSLGKKFESRKGVVEIMEHMLINYYQGILQHLKLWEKPAPQITQTKAGGLASDIE